MAKGGSYKVDTWGSSKVRKYRLIGLRRQLIAECKTDRMRLEALRMLFVLEGYSFARQDVASRVF